MGQCELTKDPKIKVRVLTLSLQIADSHPSVSFCVHGSFSPAAPELPASFSDSLVGNVTQQGLPFDERRNIRSN